MKTRKGLTLVEILIAVLILAALVVVIVHLDNNSSNEESELVRVTILGIPLSVELTSSRCGDSMSCVIQNNEVKEMEITGSGVTDISGAENGKYFLCYSNNSLAFRTLTNAGAVIASEMNDGDSELIEISGILREDGIEMESVSANGFVLDLK